MINLFWFVGFPIIVTTILYLLKNELPKTLYIVFQIIFLAYTSYAFNYVRLYGTVVEILGNYERGVGIALHFDLLSSSFILLNVFLFTAFLVFNMHKSYVNKLFLFLFYILQGLINGIFLSYDLFNIYILMELSTVVVSILIMFKKDKQSMYDGLLYLLTNMVSMTFFLLGVGYLYKMLGSMDLNIIAERITLLPNQKVLILPYALIMTGVCLKSAVMPLFSWLPRAHGTPSAPSIVSAVLSGLYIKASLYLFIRLQNIFGNVFATNNLFILLGILTAIIGFVIAISQNDIKLILAYSTVSQVGLIIIGLNLGNNYGLNGAIYHIFNHAIAKSILFLAAGIMIDHYHTRKIQNIKGVFKQLPLVSIAAIVAILSITGAPFINGSVSKYFIQKGASDLPYMSLILNFINWGTILIMIKFSMVFIGTSTKVKSTVKLNQIIVLFTLATIAILGGIKSNYFTLSLFDFNSYINPTSYLSKSIIYLAMILVGLFFYKYLYPRLSIFKKIRNFEFSFNQTILSLAIFFVFLYSYLQIQFL